MTLWVFGYGSLLWDPGFIPESQVRARLGGFHRSFCMLSIHHRGTEADPGLVLALDAERGARCTGLAFEVTAGEEDEVLRDLRARELVSSAYEERQVTVQTDDGRALRALTYVINPGHQQYCAFDLETQAQMIARAHGGRGPNAEYLQKTAAQLAGLDIHDPDIVWLAARVAALLEAG